MTIDIVSGSADDDKCNAITVANNEELWFDTDAANFSHSNCSRKLFFSNFCMVRSKLKPFELSFGANSDARFLKRFFKRPRNRPVSRTVNPTIEYC